MLEPGATSGEGAERAYVTKRGDTLKSVAESLYGSSARRDRLEAENAVIAGLNVRATLPPGVTLKAPADSA